jgi:hypothetical protein
MEIIAITPLLTWTVIKLPDGDFVPKRRDITLVEETTEAVARGN